MSSLQITVVLICIIINFLDGFDVIAIAFAAPVIVRDWSLEPAALGVVFSSGLAGMVVGALFLSPLADRFGRRPLILGCLCIISIGMLASALTDSVEQLMAMRFFTGVGVGGMLSSLTTMVAEYASDRRRQLAISILQAGYPVGGIIAGLASVQLLADHGWRSLFLVGGTMSVIMIPLVYWGLPESIDFLLGQRKSDTLGRVNKLRARTHQGTFNELPPGDSSQPSKTSVTEIFSDSYLGRTIAIWTCFVMAMSAWYFVINWTPKVLIDAGLSQKAGISGGMLLSIGGVVGGLLVGWLSSRVRVSSLVAGFMIVGIAAMATFGHLGLNLIL
ncbi:MAG: MFS transporter, partial [Pseudomonadota bacterium]